MSVQSSHGGRKCITACATKLENLERLDEQEEEERLVWLLFFAWLHTTDYDVALAYNTAWMTVRHLGVILSGKGRDPGRNIQCAHV